MTTELTREEVIAELGDWLTSNTEKKWADKQDEDAAIEYWNSVLQSAIRYLETDKQEN